MGRIVPELTLRAGSRKDYPACLALFKRVLRDFGLEYVPGVSNVSLKEMLSSKIPGIHGSLYIAEYDKKLAGMGGLWLRFLNGERYVYVAKLYVHPEYRRRGLGSLLLKKIIAHALELGVSRLYLDTDTSLKAACQLFGSVGFAPHEDAPFPIPPGCDTRLMLELAR